MGLKKAENQVKIMLADTIMAMCRNTLNYHGEVCVEGLLGITLDKEEIFLVSINQTITNPEVLKQKAESESHKSKRNERKRRSSGDESSDSESSDSQSDSENKQKKARRKRRKRKSSSQSSESSESEQENGKQSKNHTPGDNNSHYHNVDEISNASANSNSTIPNNTAGQSVAVKQEKTDDEDDLMIVKAEGLDSNSSVSQQYSDFVAGSQFPPFNQFNLSGNDGSSPFNNTNMQFLASQHLQSPDGSIPQPGPSNQETALGSLKLHQLFSPDGVTCGLCGLKCQNKSNLKRHMLTHSGERNFPCAVCGKAFTQKSNLSRHMKATHFHRDFPFPNLYKSQDDSKDSRPKDLSHQEELKSRLSLPANIRIVHQ